MVDQGRTRRFIWARGAGAVLLGAMATVVAGHPTRARADATTEPAPAPAEPAPADPAATRGARRGDGAFRRLFNPGGRFAAQAFTPADHDEAMQFMQQNAPETYGVITAMPDGDRRGQWEAAVTRAYVNYRRIKADDPELYGVILKRVQVEDGITGLTAKFRKTPANTPERATLTQQIRAQVTAWCDLTLQERQLRLARLERTVHEERLRLASDTANRERLINQRMSRLTGGGGDAPPVDVPTSEPAR